MSDRKNLVRRFYTEIWDCRNKHAMQTLLHPNFSFRSSLGHVKRGHHEFSAYVDQIHTALGSYRCIIEELLAENNQVFARMIFTGLHQAEFMGYQPTGERVSWIGGALFTFEGALIRDVWVLGDVKGLEQELEAHAAPPQDSPV